MVPTAEHKKHIERIRYYASPHAGTFGKDVPVKCAITYYMKRPKSVTDEYPVKRPDLDNMTKPVLDGIKPRSLTRKDHRDFTPQMKQALKESGVVYDDSQIVDLHLKKRFAKNNPRIVIELWKIEPKKNQEQLDLMELL